MSVGRSPGEPPPASPAGMLDRGHNGAAGGHAAARGPELSGETDARGGTWLPGFGKLASFPVARHLGLLLCYVAAGIAVTWPRVTYLAGQLPSSRDSASYVWGFWWVARQISHLADPWSTAHMAAPAGIKLGYDTLITLPGVLLTPVTLGFGDSGPALSYNLLVILVPGLLCYAMYRAARLWLESQVGAIAAGAFFGLSGMLTEQAWYHVNIAVGALFLPMALEASVRLRRRPGRRQALILGLVMGTAVLTDQESAVLAALLTAAVLLPWLIRQPSAAKLRVAGLAVLTGLVAGGAQIIAMVSEQLSGPLNVSAHVLAVSYKQYGIGLPGMFSPTSRVADFGLSVLAGPALHSRNNEQIPMFGALLTVLALAGLAASWRRRAGWLLALGWLGCAALALGSSLWIGKVQYLPWQAWWHGVRISPVMPYTWLVRVPGLESFREADRFAILGLVPAALLAGAAVNWLRFHARPLIVIVLALGILEAGYSGNPKVGTMPATMPRLDGPIAADHTDSIVLDVPFGLRGGIPEYGVPFAAQALVLAVSDGHRRAIAYASRIPAPTITASNAHAFYRYLVNAQHGVPVTAGQITAARLDLRRLHVGWAIVWWQNANIEGSVIPYLRRTGFRLAYRADGALVYRPGG